MKIILATTILLLSCGLLFGQGFSIGANVGGGYHTLNLDEPDMDNMTGIGFGGGVVFELDLLPMLGAEVDVQYAIYNYKWSGEIDDAEGEISIKTNNLVVPVLFKYKMAMPTVSPYFAIGPSLIKNLSGSITMSSDEVDTTWDIESDELETDFGLQVGYKPAFDANVDPGGFAEGDNSGADFVFLNRCMLLGFQQWAAAGFLYTPAVNTIAFEPFLLLFCLQNHGAVQIGRLQFVAALVMKNQVVVPDGDNIVVLKDFLIHAAVIDESSVKRFIVDYDSRIIGQFDLGVLARNAPVIQNDVIVRRTTNGNPALFGNDSLDNLVLKFYNDFGHTNLQPSL